MTRPSSPDSHDAQPRVTQHPSSDSPAPHRRLFSAPIDQLVMDITREFHDSDHLTSNRARARTLWRVCGLSEDDFMDLLYVARAITRSRGAIQKPAETGVPGTRNKMPYFFAVLQGELRHERLPLPGNRDAGEHRAPAR